MVGLSKQFFHGFSLVFTPTSLKWRIIHKHINESIKLIEKSKKSIKLEEKSKFVILYLKVLTKIMKLKKKVYN